MAFERELEVAKEAAKAAARVAMEYQKQGVAEETKSDESPVTAADRAAEALIVKRLSEEFPEDGIVGEEGANQESRNGRKWILDPIDGTKDFVRGIPLWAILIGLEQDGEMVAGVSHSPGQNLMLWAAKGQGSFSNGERIQTSDTSDPSHAILSFNGFNKPGLSAFSAPLLDWTSRFWAVRSLGGACDAMLVASGKADVWIEPNAAPWDLAPLKIIIEEAGGRFASLDGKNTIYGGNAYACTPGLEPYVKELLRAVPQK